MQEEYGGNYLMLMDMIRGTLVFESLHAMQLALDFLTGDLSAGTTSETYPGLQGRTNLIVCRAKDRISPEFDSEPSGGNRDILLNVWVSIPDENGTSCTCACARASHVH